MCLLGYLLVLYLGYCVERFLGFCADGGQSEGYTPFKGLIRAPQNRGNSDLVNGRSHAFSGCPPAHRLIVAVVIMMLIITMMILLLLLVASYLLLPLSSFSLAFFNSAQHSLRLTTITGW